MKAPDPIITALRAHRIAQGKSQQLVADRLGYHRRTLINWEHGYRNPGLAEIRAYAAEVGYRPALVPAIQAALGVREPSEPNSQKEGQRA